MKKILLVFLLVIGLLLTGCGPAGEDKGDDDPIDQKDPTDVNGPSGVTDPLEGIDEALILLMDGEFEGEFDGDTVSYYFYLPEDAEFVFSLEADFDSLIVIKELVTSYVVFEGDDSIFGDDVYSFISLYAGEYVVELSSRDGGTGTFYINLGEESIYTPIYVDIELSDIVVAATIQGYLLEIDEASYYSIISTGDIDLEGIISTIDGEFIAFGLDRSEEDTNFEILVYLEEGSYIIGVAAYSMSASGDYQLLVEPTTLTHVTAIEENSYINDILIAGEKNVVEFVVSSDSEVELYVVGTFDSYGIIYDSDGEIVSENDDSGFSSDFYINILLVSGAYTIEISGVDEYEAGSYVLVYENEAGISSDPDEVYDIDLNSSVTGTLGSGDIHSYTFTVPSDGYITAYLVSDFDSYGAIKNSDGNVIEFNDDASFDVYDFKIENYEITAGSYSLYVEGYESDEYGNYTLYITFGDITDEPEPDPDPEVEVFAIDLNSNVTGTIGSGDTNSYVFTIPSSGYITTYLVSDFDSIGYVIDSDGIPVYVGMGLPDTNDFLIEDLGLYAGTYSIDVTGFSTDEYGDYTLYISFEETLTSSDPEDADFTIDLNSSVMETLESDTIHTYTITVVSGGTFTAYLESDFDSWGTLQNSSEFDIEFNDESGTGSNFRLEDIELSAGTYYLIVEGLDSDEYGDYTLYVEFEESVVTEIIPNELVTGNLLSDGIDTVSFTLEHGGYIHSELTSMFDSQGTLSDVYGTTLLWDDDGGDNLNFELKGIYLEPGYYEIRINGYSSGDYGNYDLSLDIIYGNISSAIPLVLPVDTESTLDADDYDWYEIEILETGYITTYVVSSLDTYGYLLDEFGGYMNSDDDTYDDLNFYMSAYLEPGTYYIVVQGYSDVTAGDYSLHVDFSLEYPD